MRFTKRPEGTEQVAFGAPNMIDQTLFGDGKGNCFAACVASVLGVSLERVPNFCVDYPPDQWWSRYRDWLWSNFRAQALTFEPPDQAAVDNILAWMRDLNGCHFIVSGPNPDGFGHSTVWLNGELLHDPNPSRRGIARVAAVDLIVSARPGACA